MAQYAWCCPAHHPGWECIGSCKVQNASWTELRRDRTAPHLWEGEGYFCKIVGTLGTVGILARIVGKYARFSIVPKSANGTLEVFEVFSVLGSWLGSRIDECGTERTCQEKRKCGQCAKAAPLSPLANFSGVLRGFQEAHVALLAPLTNFSGVFDGLRRGDAREHYAPGKKTAATRRFELNSWSGTKETQLKSRSNVQARLLKRERSATILNAANQTKVGAKQRRVLPWGPCQNSLFDEGAVIMSNSRSTRRTCLHSGAVQIVVFLVATIACAACGAESRPSTTQLALMRLISVRTDLIGQTTKVG